MGNEDFVADWTEQDTGGLLSQTSPRATFTNLNRTTDNTYLYRDYGAAFFTDFDVEFEFFASVLPTSAAAYNRLNLIAFSEAALGDFVAIRNSQEMAYVLVSGQSGRYLRASMRDGVGGGASSAVYIAISLSTLYYCKFFRVGTTITLQVFSDANRTIQVGADATVTCNITDNYRYVMAEQSLDLNTSYANTGYVQNLDMGLVDDADEDLFAQFYLLSTITNTKDLFAKFKVAQNSEDLYAEFIVAQDSADLYASFMLRVDASAELFAEFEVNQENGSQDLMAKFGVRRIYDLSGSGGVGFTWEGVGRGHVDIQIITPTGAWIGKFPDYANWTWVELTWDDLQEVDIDGSRPDKTRVTGFLWTVHSAGERHLDDLKGLPKGGDREVFGEFIIRHEDYLDIPAEFIRNHYRRDLKGVYILRQSQPGRSPQSGGLTAIATTAPYFWGVGSYHVYAVQDPWGKKSFEALGRQWVFYAEGEINDGNTRNLAFVSGYRGVWTSKTFIPAVTNLYGGTTSRGPWAVHFDGTYIHLCYYNGTGNGSIQYVRGTPFADGTIIWGAAHLVTSADEYYWHNISTDINGYPFITYNKDFTGHWVINSSTNDGTWVTDVNQQVDTSNTTQHGMLFPLSNGYMILLHQDQTSFSEFLWDGLTWTKTVISPSLDSTAYWTAAMDTLGVIHFAYYDDVDTLQYRTRSAAGVWSSFEDLVTGIPDRTHPIILRGYGTQDQGDIVIFYHQTATLYYIRYTEGAWLSPETLITLSDNVYGTSLNANDRYTGGKITFYAQTEEDPPYSGTLWAVNLRIFNAPLVKGIFTVRYGKENLKATFTVGQGTAELKAIFQVTSREDLYAKFRVEPHKNLKAEFMVRQLTGDLAAEFMVGKMSLEVYTDVGTTGVVTLTTPDQVIAEMTRIIACETGDKLIISFDGTFVNKVTNPDTGVEINIEVEGVEIGNRLWVENSGGAGGEATKWGTSITRVYEIPSDGDYTVEVHAYNETGGVDPEYAVNYRTMSIQHFSNLS